MTFSQKKTTVYSQREEEELFATCWSDTLKYDPHAFAMVMYPWGAPGTILADQTGPRRWQRETMQAIGAHFRKNEFALSVGLTDAATVFRDAVASGRGIGKSAELGMIAHWFASCWPGSSVIVTANTEAQLRTKTMPEIRKWFALGLNSHWWELEATKISPTRWYTDALKSLRIDAAYYYVQTTVWSEANPDAFAGTHNMYGILVIFDEASGIPRNIHTVTEGFFTEPTINRIWLQRSNPRNVVNGFYDCFKPGANWRTRHIDGRDVEGTDKGVYESIISTYGLNSDEVKIEVLGQFPGSGDKSLFNADDIRAARLRPPPLSNEQPLVLAVDVARFGADKTMFAWRRGFNLRVHPLREFTKLDATQVAAKVSEAVQETRPDYVVIDGNGIGGPVADILRKEYAIRCVMFHGNGASTKPQQHLNSRADAYIGLSDFIRIVALPDSNELEEELIAITYEYDSSNLKKITEKEKIKKALGRSPDKADAIMMLFHRPWKLPRGVPVGTNQQQADEYDPLRPPHA